MRSQVNVVTILSAATATGAGSSFTPWGAKRSFHVIGETSSGSGSVVVDIEVSNDDSNWVTAATVSLSPNTSEDDGFTTDAPWKYVRANVTTISGTGATATVIMGTEG